ncbi:hypothetical protein WR25_20796 [Diploscapter pachys]|uniref:Cytosolic fatty-acid binding proteins domain-containing protein n=1 Tax=Diploscapter pachys TaxID=2018661 RepID=A0A2A2JDC2_9BILA|nr:hypothetical protein WR25_20796 [Diploscapter pachys]
MQIPFILSTVFLLVQMTDAKSIPEKFFGRFVLEKSENFDEFLAAKVNWFLRKIIQMSSITKVISKGEKPNTYNFETLSSKKNAIYHGFELGKTFEGEGMDDKKHQITFNVQGDVLTERHIRSDDPADKGEIYFYTIESDKLVLKMENNNITCRRWFKREQK